MRAKVFENKRYRGWIAALVAALVVCGSLMADRSATAGGGGGPAVVAAAATANSGLGACSSNRGKPLYDCVANVFDQLANETARQGIIDARLALRAAANQLRGAATKPQALSAISQCRSAVAAVLQRTKAAGHEVTGLSAIAGVLSRAAALIQSKG